MQILRYNLNTNFMKLLTGIALTFLSLFCFGQSSGFKDVRKIISKIPSSHESSTTSIANFIKSNFHNQEDRLKAAFYWTATNIDYAVEDIDEGLNNQGTEFIINKSLFERSGTCQAFSEIFNELAQKLNFETFVISGYVRQNSRITINYGHVWNAIRINKNWYLFDPTWAAGHFLIKADNLAQNSSNYVKKFSPEYFKVHPSDFIKTHMPFDPIWQLSNQIIKYQEFDQNQLQNGSKATFNYQKVISNLSSNTYLKNIKSEIDRIHSLGSGNRLVKNNLKTLTRNLEIATNNKNVEIYNQALKFHANGIALFNNYVTLFNQNKSNLSNKTEQLNQFLNTAQNEAKEAQSIYKSISTSNLTLQLNIKIRMAEIDELFEKIAQEEESLKRI